MKANQNNTMKTKLNSDPIKLLEKLNTDKITKFKLINHIDKISIDKVKEWYKTKFKKKQYFLILMYNRNGKYSLFSVATSNNYFEYGKGAYLIDQDMVKNETLTSLSLLFYHEQSSVPFKIEFNIDELQNTVKKNDKGVSLALNPNNLKGFINSQVIEKVLKGQELTDDMAFMKKLIIINLLVSAITIGIIAKSMGWF